MNAHSMIGRLVVLPDLLPRAVPSAANVDTTTNSTYLVEGLAAQFAVESLNRRTPPQFRGLVSDTQAVGYTLTCVHPGVAGDAAYYAQLEDSDTLLGAASFGTYVQTDTILNSATTNISVERCLTTTDNERQTIWLALLVRSNSNYQVVIMYRGASDTTWSIHATVSNALYDQDVLHSFHFCADKRLCLFVSNSDKLYCYTCEYPYIGNDWSLLFAKTDSKTGDTGWDRENSVYYYDTKKKYIFSVWLDISIGRVIHTGISSALSSASETINFNEYKTWNIAGTSDQFLTFFDPVSGEFYVVVTAIESGDIPNSRIYILKGLYLNSTTTGGFAYNGYETLYGGYYREDRIYLFSRNSAGDRLLFSSYGLTGYSLSTVTGVPLTYRIPTKSTVGYANNYIYFFGQKNASYQVNDYSYSCTVLQGIQNVVLPPETTSIRNALQEVAGTYFEGVQLPNNVGWSASGTGTVNTVYEEYRTGMQTSSTVRTYTRTLPYSDSTVSGASLVGCRIVLKANNTTDTCPGVNLHIPTYDMESYLEVQTKHSSTQLILTDIVSGTAIITITHGGGYFDYVLLLDRESRNCYVYWRNHSYGAWTIEGPVSVGYFAGLNENFAVRIGNSTISNTATSTYYYASMIKLTQTTDNSHMGLPLSPGVSPFGSNILVSQSKGEAYITDTVVVTAGEVGGPLNALSFQDYRQSPRVLHKLIAPEEGLIQWTCNLSDFGLPDRLGLFVGQRGGLGGITLRGYSTDWETIGSMSLLSPDVGGAWVRNGDKIRANAAVRDVLIEANSLVGATVQLGDDSTLYEVTKNTHGYWSNAAGKRSLEITLAATGSGTSLGSAPTSGSSLVLYPKRVLKILNITDPSNFSKFQLMFAFPNGISEAYLTNLFLFEPVIGSHAHEPNYQVGYIPNIDTKRTESGVITNLLKGPKQRSVSMSYQGVDSDRTVSIGAYITSDTSIDFMNAAQEVASEVDPCLFVPCLKLDEDGSLTASGHTVFYGQLQMTQAPTGSHLYSVSDRNRFSFTISCVEMV